MSSELEDFVGSNEIDLTSVDMPTDSPAETPEKRPLNSDTKKCIHFTDGDVLVCEEETRKCSIVSENASIDESTVDSVCSLKYVIPWFCTK